MRLLALLLLLPTLAFGQGISTQPATFREKVLASFPLTTSGALIEDDALTTTHVYWTDTTLVDTKGGNAWVKNEAITVISDGNPFTFPRYGASVSSSNYAYTAASESGPTDFVGDFTTCIVMMIPGAAAAVYPFRDVNAGGTKGYVFHINGANAYFAHSSAGGLNYDLSQANAIVGGINVLCGGVNGNTAYFKANLGTTASKVVTITPATDAKATIVYGPSDRMYEVWASATPWNEANVVAIQKKIFGMAGSGLSSPLTVTRATTATFIPREADCATKQCLFTAPSGVARITDSGLLVEKATINYAYQSSNLTSGASAVSPWGLAGAPAPTISTITGTPFGGVWSEITSNSTDGGISQTITTASTATATASVWAARSSGTGSAEVMVRCGGTTGNTATCYRSDGGTCTTGPRPGYAADVVGTMRDLGTTPVRLSMRVTCGAGAQTSWRLQLNPGEFGVSTGTVRFTGAQLEIQDYPTSLCPTTAGTCTRDADQVSATIPATPRQFCLGGTFKPEGNRAWFDGSVEIMLSTLGGTDYSNLYSDGTLLIWQISTAGTGRSFIAQPTYVNGSTHRFMGCTPGTPSLGLWDSRAPVPLALYSSGGGGTAYNSGTTLQIGKQGSNLYFGGFIKDLKFCAASAAKECK